MIDAQAARLRERVAAAAPAGGASPSTPRSGSIAAGSGGEVRLARTVAVASGKGGVGKSTVALGIAMAAAERGVRTALVDADLGLANLDLLAGIRARRTMADWLGGRASLSECFVTVAPRLWMLPGASGLARMADLRVDQRARMIEGLSRVAGHVQLMVVDLGAGIAAGTLDIAAAADRVLLVATPEPTAMTDAYSFAKACVRSGSRARWSCVTNMARDEGEGARTALRLAAAARTHIGIEVDGAGSVPFDLAVADAVRAGRPLLADSSRSRAARSIRAIEARLSGAGGGQGAEAGFFRALAGRIGVRLTPTAAAAAVGVAALGGLVAG